MTRASTDEKEASGAWLKVGIYRRSTLSKLSQRAEWAWFCLQLFSAEDDNAGRVRKRDLVTALHRKVGQKAAAGLVAELVEEGLVIEHSDHYELPRFPDENPPAAVWHDEVQRHRWRRDKALKRDGSLCRRIKERDRHLCRFCGIRVNWDDKNGKGGGTYDHLDPDGDNQIDNVVVACRGCNSRKGCRTVEQWIASDARHGRTLKRSGTTAAAADAIDEARWKEQNE